MLRGGLFSFAFILSAGLAMAAPYAAMVIDAKSGEVLHSRNADTRLHPASLTKMMTLYVAFAAVERGEITLDTKIKVSKKAARQPPSKLGLRAGSSVRLRYLIRASAVKSANDAAMVIAEGISGSQAAFSDRMNRQAKALGMTKTTFKNPSGLTQRGHTSTARDMTILGRRLLTDFPEYYNLFSRRTADTGIKTVNNTNRKVLNSYKGADGIKTGYTVAAGFNLVASAERGNKRVIATVFGGKSSASRNRRVVELLDMGFDRAKATRYAAAPPKVLVPPGVGRVDAVGRRVAIANIRPKYRPANLGEDNTDVLAVERAIVSANLAKLGGGEAAAPRVENITPAQGDADESEAVLIAAITRGIEQMPSSVVLGRVEARVIERPKLRTDRRKWAVHLGIYGTRVRAEKALLEAVLADISSLDGALRQVKSTSRGYHAEFVGITEINANKVCARLKAETSECEAVLAVAINN